MTELDDLAETLEPIRVTSPTTALTVGPSETPLARTVSDRPIVSTAPLTLPRRPIELVAGLGLVDIAAPHSWDHSTWNEGGAGFALSFPSLVFLERLQPPDHEDGQLVRQPATSLTERQSSLFRDGRQLSASPTDRSGPRADRADPLSEPPLSVLRVDRTVSRGERATPRTKGDRATLRTDPPNAQGHGQGRERIPSKEQARSRAERIRPRATDEPDTGRSEPTSESVSTRSDVSKTAASGEGAEESAPESARRARETTTLVSRVPPDVTSALAGGADDALAKASTRVRHGGRRLPFPRPLDRPPREHASPLATAPVRDGPVALRFAVGDARASAADGERDRDPTSQSAATGVAPGEERPRLPDRDSTESADRARAPPQEDDDAGPSQTPITNVHERDRAAARASRTVAEPAWMTVATAVDPGHPGESLRVSRPVELTYRSPQTVEARAHREAARTAASTQAPSTGPDREGAAVAGVTPVAGEASSAPDSNGEPTAPAPRGRPSEYGAGGPSRQPVHTGGGPGDRRESGWGEGDRGSSPVLDRRPPLVSSASADVHGTEALPQGSVTDVSTRRRFAGPGGADHTGEGGRPALQRQPAAASSGGLTPETATLTYPLLKPTREDVVGTAPASGDTTTRARERIGREQPTALREGQPDGPRSSTVLGVTDRTTGRPERSDSSPLQDEGSFTAPRRSPTALRDSLTVPSGPLTAPRLSHAVRTRQPDESALHTGDTLEAGSQRGQRERVSEPDHPERPATVVASEPPSSGVVSDRSTLETRTPWRSTPDQLGPPRSGVRSPSQPPFPILPTTDRVPRPSSTPELRVLQRRADGQRPSQTTNRTREGATGIVSGPGSPTSGGAPGSDEMWIPGETRLPDDPSTAHSAGEAPALTLAQSVAGPSHGRQTLMSDAGGAFTVHPSEEFEMPSLTLQTVQPSESASEASDRSPASSARPTAGQSRSGASSGSRADEKRRRRPPSETRIERARSSRQEARSTPARQRTPAAPTEPSSQPGRTRRSSRSTETPPQGYDASVRYPDLTLKTLAPRIDATRREEPSRDITHVDSSRRSRERTVVEAATDTLDDSRRTDVGRVVERVHRELERKRRIERERRGL